MTVKIIRKFRISETYMFSKETNRMTSLCDFWESKISSISEDPSYEEIRGEVRKYDFNMFQNPDILIL